MLPEDVLPPPDLVGGGGGGGGGGEVAFAGFGGLGAGDGLTAEELPDLVWLLPLPDLAVLESPLPEDEPLLEDFVEVSWLDFGLLVPLEAESPRPLPALPVSAAEDSPCCFVCPRPLPWCDLGEPAPLP